MPKENYGWQFLGTFILSAMINLTLLFLNLTTTPTSHNAYDYVRITIASFRTLLFIFLTIISAVPRTRHITLDDFEAPDGPLNSPLTPLDSGQGDQRNHTHVGWVNYMRSFKVFLCITLS
jgi:hypothetical protein